MKDTLQSEGSEPSSEETSEYWLDDTVAPIAWHEAGDAYDVDTVQDSGVEAHEEDLAFIGHWVHRDALGSTPSPREVARSTEMEETHDADLSLFQTDVSAHIHSQATPIHDKVPVRTHPLPVVSTPGEETVEWHEVTVTEWWKTPRALMIMLVVLFLLAMASLVHMVVSATGS